MPVSAKWLGPSRDAPGAAAPRGARGPLRPQHLHRDQPPRRRQRRLAARRDQPGQRRRQRRGGNGGNGQGGGIWNGSPSPVGGTPSTLTIVGSTLVNNRADGGAAGSAGSAGLGQGGGIYILPGGTVSVDLVTDITGNHASTSDDDVFGVLSFI